MYRHALNEARPEEKRVEGAVLLEKKVTLWGSVTLERIEVDSAYAFTLCGCTASHL